MAIPGRVLDWLKHHPAIVALLSAWWILDILWAASPSLRAWSVGMLSTLPLWLEEIVAAIIVPFLVWLGVQARAKDRRTLASAGYQGGA